MCFTRFFGSQTNSSFVENEKKKKKNKYEINMKYIVMTARALVMLHKNHLGMDE